ncbi:hypothetical protein ONS95_014445 [Cadophora gregata]|uniref:uncharacterized protein n=1 Tax=Cadophora gregata TaxID=51156 RepID=UPI0026DC3A43|nr:uncharacterized protein ONS95_014445 [Cadophora gregata]KAK0112709.1 hypothetical protein ONS95_014445 [Cadophora gregata]KAK0124842.1 hypothetical protein ONS96_008721 [Cadophora gregata f. sp. sojae]
MHPNGAIAIIIILILLVFGGLTYALVHWITNTPKKSPSSEQQSGTTTSRGQSTSQARTSSS